MFCGQLYRHVTLKHSYIFEKRAKQYYNSEFYVYLDIQSVPRSKLSVSVIKTSQLMLYREIIAVYSQSTQNT